MSVKSLVCLLALVSSSFAFAEEEDLQPVPKLPIVIAEAAAPTRPQFKSLPEEIAHFDAEFAALDNSKAIALCMVIDQIKPQVEKQCLATPKPECTIAVPLLAHVKEACTARLKAIDGKK